MGEVLNGTDEKLNGTIKTDTGYGNAGSGGSTSAPDTGRTGGSGGNTGGSTGGNTKEKIVPQMVSVDEPLTEEQKKAERNRRRRERYAAEKAESGQTVKPRKVNKAKKNESPVSNFSNEQLNALLVSTSAVIASRPNCQHWLLTEAEADSITKPLLAMIAESEKLELIAKNSNQIALAIACITIFAPRLFITIQQSKQTPKKETKPNARPQQVRPPETGDKKPNQVNDAKPPVTDTNNDIVLSWDD